MPNDANKKLLLPPLIPVSPNSLRRHHRTRDKQNRGDSEFFESSKMNPNSPDKISNGQPLYEFAEFSYDAKDKVLFRSGEIIQLAPKACELLSGLSEEANLTHHISALRKALGKDKNGRKFIATIPHKGYRFVAPISQASNGSTEFTISERMKAPAVERVEIETIEAVENNQKVLTNEGVLALPEKSLTTNRRRSFWVIPAILAGGALAILLAVLCSIISLTLYLT